MNNKWFNLAGVLGTMFLSLYFSIQIFTPLNIHEKAGVIVKIAKGQGTIDIAQSLETAGLIRSSSFFQSYSFLKGVSRKLQAGEYLLSPSFSLSQIIRKLATGDIHKEPVTFVEGWTLKDHKELAGAASKDFSQEFDFLKDKPKSQNLEGYLFADTYLVESDESAESVVKRMLKNFGKHLTSDIRKEIQRQKKTIFQIVTMASLLEGEVRGAQDRKIVAGILWKRLGAGVALQVDATVLYAKEEHTEKISKQDTQIDSPYNTYKYPGLPLGPIGNPGIESITAALYPTESPYWYYLSTPRGETILSKTLEEHNLAKAKYLYP